MKHPDLSLPGLNRSRHKSKIRYAWDACVRMDSNPRNADFRCLHCKAHISADPLLSGVHNRNHCPYCLHSRHMDVWEAGDRLSACKAPMQPVGLTTKHTRKKYGLAKHGELMLVHRCLECGKLSANRLAADDDAERIYQIFRQSCTDVPHQPEQSGSIHLLTESDVWLVEAQLFGHFPSLPESSGREGVFC